MNELIKNLIDGKPPSVTESIGDKVGIGHSSLRALLKKEKEFLENMPWRHRNRIYLFGGPWVSVPRGPRREEWLMASPHLLNVRRCMTQWVETVPGFGYTVEEFPKLLQDNLPNRTQFNEVIPMTGNNDFEQIRATGGLRKGEMAVISATTSKTLQQGLPNRRQFGSVTKLAKRIGQYTAI